MTSVERRTVFGDLRPETFSTSFIERQNLTMRMCMRRLARLTNGFSKKLENHVSATALHFAYYNFCRVHRTVKVTPAMAAGVMYHPLDGERFAGCSDGGRMSIGSKDFGLLRLQRDRICAIIVNENTPPVYRWTPRGRPLGLSFYEVAE